MLHLGSGHPWLLQTNQLTGELEHFETNQLTGELEPLRGCTALQVLNLNNNLLNGGLGPLRGYTALRNRTSFNQMGHLTAGLEPLRGCKALCELSLENDQLVPSVEDMAHFQEQCGWAEQEDGESD